MSLDPNPVFRKMIVPWYDSEGACYAMIVSMLCVLLFGIAGVSVAVESPEFSGHIWVPVLIIIFSSLLILISVYKLLKIYSEQ